MEGGVGESYLIWVSRSLNIFVSPYLAITII